MASVSKHEQLNGSSREERADQKEQHIYSLIGRSWDDFKIENRCGSVKRLNVALERTTVCNGDLFAALKLNLNMVNGL